MEISMEISLKTKNRVTIWSTNPFPRHEWVSEWVKLPSCVWLFGTPWTVAYQAPLSMRFFRQEYWSAVPFPSQEIFPTQGLNPGLRSNLGLPYCRWMLYPLSHQGSPKAYIWRKRIWKYTCTSMLTAALFTITKTWKQPKRLLTDEWIKKDVVYIQWDITQP